MHLATCHSKTFDLKLVEMDHALKFNSYFGQTQYEYFIDKTDANSQN